MVGLSSCGPMTIQDSVTLMHYTHGPYVRINRQSLRRDNPAGFPTIPYFNDELT